VKRRIGPSDDDIGVRVNTEIKINRFDNSPFYKDVKKMLREGTFDLKKDLRQIRFLAFELSANPVKAVKKESPSKNLEGKVLVVNKKYDFAVINLGARDGVSAGDMLSIYRKGNYIGDIVIERVDEMMSSANFLSSNTKEKVKEGDKVVYKSS